MRRTISPLQAGVCIAIALALVLGIGYLMTNRRAGGNYEPLPPAQSRADMVRNMRVHGRQMLQQQPRSHPGQ